MPSYQMCRFYHFIEIFGQNVRKLIFPWPKFFDSMLWLKEWQTKMRTWFERSRKRNNVQIKVKFCSYHRYGEINPSSWMADHSIRCECIFKREINKPLLMNRLRLDFNGAIAIASKCKCMQLDLSSCIFVWRWIN